MRSIIASIAASIVASGGCSPSAEPAPPAPIEAPPRVAAAPARARKVEDEAVPEPQYGRPARLATPAVRLASFETQSPPQEAEPAESAEDAAHRVSDAVERKQDLLAQAQERLDAALREQGPRYSTPAEAQTAEAMLAVVGHLHAKNSAILAGYREVFQIRRELKSDLEALPEHCAKAASQYEQWGLLCDVPSLKANYRALSDLFRARASESVVEARDLLADYDPATEKFLSQWSLFLERLKNSLDKYPPRRMDQALRTQVLEDLNRHVAALDELSNSIRSWSDVAKAQAAGGRAPAPRPAPEPVRDGSGGASPDSRPRAERLAPTAPAVRQASARAPGEAGGDAVVERLEAEFDGLLASRSRRLNSITQAEVPILAARYGSGDGRIPMYSARALRDGDAEPVGHTFVSRAAMRRVVMVYEEVPPGIPASSVPDDLVIIKSADLQAVVRSSQALAAARRASSGATTAPRFASGRP